MVPVEAHLRAEGMTVYTNTHIQHIKTSGDQKTIYFLHRGQPQHVTANSILQALGRRPNIDGLNLEAAQVGTHKGTIQVDMNMRTSQPHIFAVGDVNGLHEIVHIAIEQGEIAGWKRDASRSATQALS